jgi:hypothetical protein
LIILSGEFNKRGDFQMKYITPQIANVLSALRTIQGSEKGNTPALDNHSEQPFNTIAAYEADE